SGAGHRAGGMSGPPPESKEVPHFHGHRERLKARFHETGAEKFADYELLELILYLALPRRDTKPLAKALMAKFGTFSAVLAAPRARLQEVAGVGDAAVHALKLVQCAAQRYARDCVRGGNVLDSWTARLDYSRAAMANQPVEQFRILFLDRRNALIADELQQTGTVDHTPVY